jgi:ribosomal protein L11 methyltransferase
MDDGFLTIVVTVPHQSLDIISDCAADFGTLGSNETGDDPVTVTFWFPADTDMLSVEAAFRALLSEETREEFTPIHATQPARDWEQAWRQSLNPLRVGQNWLIRTSWQSSEGFGKRTTLVIDPKMAFGTGTHATTQLCLEEIERLPLTGARVLDVGTGTGILAVAAAKMGAKVVLAAEVDEQAIECAKENVELNGVPKQVQLFTGTLNSVPSGRVDFITANIEFRTLANIGRELLNRLQKNGLSVFSGILQQESDAFVREMEGMGWRILRVTRRYDPGTSDGWICFLARPCSNNDFRETPARQIQ